MGLGLFGVPQPQGVGVLGVVAGDGHVAGDGQHPGVPLVDDVQVVVGPELPEGSAKVDLLHLVGPGDDPGVALVLPVVGQLHLLAVHDLLPEQAQLVADGVAAGGDLQGGQAVQVAGGQAAQAAVAQPRVGLHVENVGGLEPQVLQGFPHGLEHPQVVGVLHQAPAHQELQGHIVDLPQLLLADLAAGLHRVGAHPVPQHHGAGLHHVCLGGLLHGAAEVQAQLVADGLLHGLLGVVFHMALFSSFLMQDKAGGASRRHTPAGLFMPRPL